MKSLDKKKTEPKKLEWVNKIDFVDDWLEIDCEVIWGKKGVKTLIDFIQSLIQSTKEETVREVLELLPNMGKLVVIEARIGDGKNYADYYQGKYDFIEEFRKKITSLLKE